jgi:hypothetical protein
MAGSQIAHFENASTLKQYVPEKKTFYQQGSAFVEKILTIS